MKPGNTGESAWYRHEDSTGAAVIVLLWMAVAVWAGRRLLDAI
jgi:hypothetical protein